MKLRKAVRATLYGLLFSLAIQYVQTFKVQAVQGVLTRCVWRYDDKL